MGKVTKAVIPVAGLGTRFLPATKAMPKEMLPVVDKPVIQYVVEEAVEADVPHILMVTGRNKHAVENHFDRAFELETRLEQKGDSAKLNAVAESTELADIHYVRQGDALGLGHAVSKARAFVANEPFALLLGDEIVQGDESFLARMIAIAEKYRATVVALLEVPLSEVHKYGIATIEGFPAEDADVVRITSLVEKPAQETAPSRFAVVGRYVLQPEIFDVIDNLKPGVGGEIQLTDALNELSKNTEQEKPVLGVVLRGRRLDMGNQLTFLQATVELALERDDIGSDFREWLKEYSSKL
ncbi:MAG: UTP--glucose-1-phosphate uridylyltransferase GalU [Aurantimicrobium sp.]|uniref:UTP--glucose-1-phosphate uridylyltransferase GalU n=1 Tax=Aurantimicrobium sp. TaxID=1930784 RepID=UPI002FCB62F1